MLKLYVHRGLPKLTFSYHFSTTLVFIIDDTRHNVKPVYINKTFHRVLLQKGENTPINALMKCLIAPM